CQLDGGGSGYDLPEWHPLVAVDQLAFLNGHLARLYAPFGGSGSLQALTSASGGCEIGSTARFRSGTAGEIGKRATDFAIDIVHRIVALRRSVFDLDVLPAAAKLFLHIGRSLGDDAVANIGMGCVDRHFARGRNAQPGRELRCIAIAVPRLGAGGGSLCIGGDSHDHGATSTKHGCDKAAAAQFELFSHFVLPQAFICSTAL